MGKPRIILADSDFNYVIPLQYKFISEYFDRIDLEIISSKAYFDKLFSTPQQADILIVSEDMYSNSLPRHNIGKIFLMTEQQEDEQTSNLHVYPIFKYTSVKEIFNEITSTCAGVLQVMTNNEQNPQIVLVYSACGGTGKTTVAMGMCAGLTRNHRRVLYINADHLQTFQHMMDNSSPISGADVYSTLLKNERDPFLVLCHTIRKEYFNYLPPFKSSLMALSLKYDIFEKIARAAKESGDYDFIVVDADPSFDAEKAKLFGIADKILLVTTQSRAAVCATNTLAANINDISSDKYIFVCNNFHKDMDNAMIHPDLDIRFTINEYIDHIPHISQLRCDEFAKINSIQKMSMLVI